MDAAGESSTTTTSTHVATMVLTTSQPAAQIPRDCAVLLQKDLSEAQKLDIAQNFASFSPPSTYQFPTKVEYGKHRSFQHCYLQSHKWLGYSAQLDGCLCLPCCLFGSDSAQNFVQSLFSNWTKLNNKVTSHSNSSTHIKCAAALISFLEVHSGTQPTIDTSLDKSSQELYDRNCKRLDAVIDCVVLCGKQNIAFRGHCDANTQTSSVNKGIFKAILDFRALGDPVLQKHLAEGPRNAQYTSPETQNEIISICKSLILDNIANDVKENGLFTIICDECTDAGNEEQLSLSVQYITKELVLQEAFIGFYQLNEGVTGKAIATTIEAALAECHLDPTKMRGQAYDGASNMSGQYKGCAAIIQQKYPLATYSHCCSHALNLVIVHACSLIQVQNLFGLMDKVYKFFDSHPKRQYTLNRFCDSSSAKLKSLCQTRWLRRIEAFHILMDMFDSIIMSFDHIAENPSAWSRESIVNAESLSKAMLHFQFIITLHSVERYMSYTESLTRALQARALDLLQAVRHIDTLKQVLTDARSNIDANFHAIFESASRCALKYDVPVTTPRRCSLQLGCDNQPGSTTEECYCRSLAIPFLDHLRTEIETRFNSHSIMAMRCLGVIPSCFFAEGKASDEEIIAFFQDDITFTSAARTELELWRSHFSGQELPDTPLAALQHANPHLFPNVRKMLIRIMVLPVTSCEAERFFSVLRRIKTYLHSTMKQDRLSGLALLNIHQEYLPPTATIRSEFLKKNCRLMKDRLL